jgi:hypothetical protein
VAVLIDPDTGAMEELELPDAYDRISRITAQAADNPSDVRDVALLWAQSTSTIAFWSLGQVGTRAYRSLDVRGTGIRVSAVEDVPGQDEEAAQQLKILRGQAAAEFRLLDLQERTDYPLEIEQDTDFELSIAPDGRRVWVHGTQPGRISRVLLTVPPGRSEELVVERDVSAVHDIERKDGGRAALVMHQVEVLEGGRGTLAVTLFDAEDPDSTDTRFFTGLLLGGLR